MALKEIIDGGLGGSGDLIKTAGTTLAAGAVIVKSMVRVPKNHRGIPTVRENPERIRGPRKGERYKTVGSGIHFVVPFLGGIESRSMQKQPNDIQAFEVMCKDGKFKVDASIVWYVKQAKWNNTLSPVSEPTEVPPLAKRLEAKFYGASDRFWRRYLTGEKTDVASRQITEDDENLYRSLFEIEKDKLDNYIRALARTGIVAAAKEVTSDDLLIPDVALPKTYELNGDKLDKHGVAIESIMINSFAPSEAQVAVNGIRDLFFKDPDGVVNVAGAAIQAIRAVGE